MYKKYPESRAGYLKKYLELTIFFFFELLDSKKFYKLT